MFIDEIKIFARAGHGGRGCVSFRREKFVPKGGPDGGNGGRGGSVILEASHDINNLIAQYYSPRLIAQKGGHGQGQGKEGKGGKDLIIKVPCGTLVWKIIEHDEENSLVEPLAPGESMDDFDENDEFQGTGEKIEMEGVDEEDFEDDDEDFVTDGDVDFEDDEEFADGDDDEGEEWRAADDDDAEAQQEADGDLDGPAESETSQAFMTSNSNRVIRYAGNVRAIEIDVSKEVDAPEVGETAKKELIADLTTHGERFVLCQGGRGGLGNKNFATARRQTPRFAQPGEAGEEGNFFLELQIIAEIGLVGYPNAGKSTVLTAISAARPKIAPYPFTTLHPQIGVLQYEDYARLTVCDIPGIIEGAHNNVGLGHEFLRHIRRCKVLVIVLDMAGMDAREPWDDYTQLLEELRLYSSEIAEKPRLIAANKMDEEPACDNLKIFREKFPDLQVVEIAAAFDEGIEEFKLAMRRAVETA